MTKPQFNHQPRNLARRSLLPGVLVSVLFASLVPMTDATRSLNCYECENTQYTASQAHKGDKACASLPLPKKFLVNQTTAEISEILPEEEGDDNVVCEVMLTIFKLQHDPKLKVYGLTRNLRTESYYGFDTKKFPMKLKPGETSRCVQLGKDTEQFVWKTCYCFTNACNDVLSLEKLRDLKITEVYDAPQQH